MDIKNFLQSNNISYNDNSSIWGVIFPSKFTYLLGPTATALSMKYHVLHFNNEGIAVIGINNITGKIDTNTLVFIPRSIITSVIFDKKLFSYKLEIITTNGNLSYKVNKTMIGASWHKLNLENILSNKN